MSVAHDPHQNHLLAALPEMDFDRMSASLKLVPLRLGQVLYESGSQQRSVYFPTTAIVSLLYMLANGAAAEIAVVGNEGIIGVSLFMGGETTPSRAVVQSAGHAYQWTGRLLKEEFTRGGAMQHLLLRYTQALLKAQHRIVSVANDERSPPFSMHDAETLIAALHRDWGEAQGNYHEFRFFTRLRPSEQIALVLSDLDLVNGIISINKARVSGVDRHMTKTGDDRRVQLCPRALLVLKRQLRLRARLDASGKVDHYHVFFLQSGEPIRTLHHPQVRWRKTLQSLKLRYRRPYTARHSSVSWNLMIGKNALWVAKQHGHSIATMPALMPPGPRGRSKPISKRSRTR